jgi:hypothetical protein
MDENIIFELAQQGNHLIWVKNDLKAIQAICEEYYMVITDTTRKDYLGCVINIIGEAIDFVAEASDFVDFAVQGYRD